MFLLTTLWNTFLYFPLINILIFLYHALGNNLGWAIIGVTVLIRLIMVPLTNPGMRSTQKMQELKPHIDKLKEKHKDDKQELAKAQFELYREHGINPFANFLPMVLQFLVLFALFQAFNNVLHPTGAVSDLNQILYPFLHLAENIQLNASFFYLDVMKPDVFLLPFTINLGLFAINAVPGFFLLAAALIQFISFKMMMPKTEPQKNASDAEDMAISMQKQMMYLMPIITILIGVNFASGLVLYWLTYSIATIAQQVYIKRTTPSNTLIKPAVANNK